VKKKKRGALYYLKRDMFLYLLLLPVILYYFVFKYLPMGGIVMAFQDFNIFKGIFHSEFVGLDVFRKILKSQQFWNSVLGHIAGTTDFGLTAADESSP